MARKVWFVAGASTGFGRLWAEAALRRGDLVAATARDTAAINDLAATYTDQVQLLQVDVTDDNQVVDAINQAHKHFGRLDIVLGNAGYGAIEEASVDDARSNVLGTLLVVQAAKPFLREQRNGHIIVISGIAGLGNYPLGGIYHATKVAVEALVESLTQEVAGFGIHVTFVELGPFATEFMSDPSLKLTRPNPAYEESRTQLQSLFGAAEFEDPQKTVPALLRVVDAPKPPEHVIFGPLLDGIRTPYASRVADSEEWDWEKISVPLIQDSVWHVH
jgi:NADP-dependent 3-hydroxy acid dehydrogenase YdfG